MTREKYKKSYKTLVINRITYKNIYWILKLNHCRTGAWSENKAYITSGSNCLYCRCCWNVLLSISFLRLPSWLFSLIVISMLFRKVSGCSFGRYRDVLSVGIGMFFRKVWDVLDRISKVYFFHHANESVK